MDWFLYDRDHRHKRVKATTETEWVKQTIGAVLVSLLLLTDDFNRFHLTFWCYIVDFKQVNVGWVEVPNFKNHC